MPDKLLHCLLAKPYEQTKSDTYDCGDTGTAVSEMIAYIRCLSSFSYQRFLIVQPIAIDRFAGTYARFSSSFTHSPSIDV